MKKLNRILVTCLTSIIFFLSCNISYGQPDVLNGDLGVFGWSDYSITYTMKVVSPPFEGLTHIKNVYIPFNHRLGKVQNGKIWRFYINNSEKLEYDIDNIQKTTSEYCIFDLGHSSGIEFENTGINGAWSFARYLITFNVHSTNKKYSFFFNCLDSKYGQLINGNLYGADFYFEFLPSLDKVQISYYISGIGNVIVGSVFSYDTLSGGLPSKEFKVWEILKNSANPLERKFYVSTTPFPICPASVENNSIRNLTLGTTLVFDTVYNNLGELDRFGYNTVMDDFYYFYYYLPPIPEGYNSLGNTFTTPAWFTMESGIIKPGFKLTIAQNDTIILKYNKRLWITGYISGPVGGDTIVFSQNSTLIKEQNSLINTCYRGVLIDSGCNSMWNNNTSYRTFEYSTINFCGLNHTVNNGGSVLIDGNAYLRLGDNTVLTFDGGGSYLHLKQNAKVEFGNNSKIIFKNGAYLIANSAQFSSVSLYEYGEGFVFENSGMTTSLIGCTFTNLKNPIKIINDESSSYYYKNIKNNIFNFPPISGCKAIYIENIYSLNIEQNTFNLTNNNSQGIYIRNSFNPGPPPRDAGDTSEYYPNNLNIKNNIFNNGNIAIILLSFASEMTSYYISDNNFNVNSSGLNFLGRKITGDIKNNSYNNIYSTFGVYLYQSNVNMYQNNISAYDNALNVMSNSNVNLSPLPINDDELLLLGGRNTIQSDNSHTIVYNNSFINMDYGENIFTRNSNPQVYHLFGTLNILNTTYNVRNNCFNGLHSPISNLHNSNQEPVYPYFIGSTFNCNFSTNNGENFIVSDKGYDIYDTIYIINNYTGILPHPDEELYTGAVQHRLNGDYFDAILLYKNLIDSNVSSEYLMSSLYEIYSCYEGLDTSESQNYRDLIFGNLKTYLEDKISSNNYSSEFYDAAYNLTLMCLARMSEYAQAADGYEFIVLFHPDPTISLLASWDYDAVISLLGGGSGSSIENIAINESRFLDKKIKYYTNKIKEDPILHKIKKVYDKMKKEREPGYEKIYMDKGQNIMNAKQKIKNRMEEEKK